MKDGGRGERLEIRMSEKDKELLRECAASSDMTMADYLIELIRLKYVFTKKD